MDVPVLAHPGAHADASAPEDECVAVGGAVGGGDEWGGGGGGRGSMACRALIVRTYYIYV